ncbi:aminotransferase class III-fold pyridoxal phosphate-dependent enzyme [Roseomonas eburnea]|uniref:Aminotransferase class III-fold pyridoxal phosphate-dependent enzyme n=1 Tax=Neoroseomonas eburnea TaxID=1346889 RepID=A0A9X9XGI1_9PROT|nr:aminotransferase [Neoroseomonas eburnea]MBR0682817.1 aminotransferase class III-fold pyridoxal phosphate-dependent enzyme [Neoroseomonas eburnea]
MTHLAPNSPHARDVASVLHPYTHARRHLETGPTIFSEGSGIYIHDDTGRAYMEGASALWCASLGFASERLAKVAYETMRRMGYYHIFRGASNEPAIDLCEKLLAIAPVPMSKVLLQCSGSEANDSALKLVWYHWNAQGRPEKRKIISRKASYHGSTVATICLTGIPDFHKGFGMPFEGFLYADCPHYYRDHEEGETEEQFSQRMADALEEMILREGPDTIGAFWADPIQGGGAGALPPPARYFEKIQAVLRKYDILMVADEVICGFGRTGNMWGSQTCGVVPDIVTCAKALSAAMQPISAVLMNERIFQSVMTQSDRLGSFVHGFTYAGHPVAAAVALETLRIYEEMDLVAHVKALEPIFLRAFGALKDHPLVGDVAGHGLMGGVELVQDKAKRRPFPEGQKIGAKVDAHARERGLILRTTADRVALSPPLIITEEEIVEMAARLRGALDDTFAEIAA